MTRILPVRHQPPFDPARFLSHDAPSADAIPLDVAIVGAGPAGLCCAIELARLAQAAAAEGRPGAELQIGVLEKAGGLGEHSLSGAVVNPRVFRELFPDVPDQDLPFRQPVPGEAVYFLSATGATRLPTPPTMQNHGNYCASLSEMVRWLGARAEALGVNLFTGFPVDALLVEGEGAAGRVRGVRTVPAGLRRDGSPGDAHQPATDVLAPVTVLSEGTRGPLGQAWRAWQGVTATNPPSFALGVKEVWHVRRPLDRVIHTLGYPLAGDTFGGTWCYPMGPEQVSIGLVAALDSPDAALDVHEALQRLKLHPLFREILEGGELVEWGAKTIPEGGYHALPSRRSGAGVVLAGDTLGVVDVPSLKGIHYAMQSGVLAARAIFAALASGEAAGDDAATAAQALAAYDRALEASWVIADLKRSRNVRNAFKDGFVAGAVKAGLMTLTGGTFPGGTIAMHDDADAERTRANRVPFTPDGVLTFSKVDAVFKSGNQTRDDIPSHLVIGKDISSEVADFYARLCPAGVYERDGDRLAVNAPNCVDCKATDVVGPRWTPREGGSGPAYRQM